MKEGLLQESHRRSAGVSIVDWNAARDGHVNSPDRKNPKKPKQQAAHSMILSWETGRADHTCRRTHNTDGVIGKRFGLGRLVDIRWTPRKT